MEQSNGCLIAPDGRFGGAAHEEFTPSCKRAVSYSVTWKGNAISARCLCSFFFCCLLFLRCFFFFPFPLKPLESLEFVFVTAAACRGLNRGVGSAAPLAGSLQLAPASSPAESLTLCTWDAEGSAAPFWSRIISLKICLFPSLCPSTDYADAWLPWQEQGERGRSELGAPHPRLRTTGFVRRLLVNLQRNHSTNRSAVTMSKGLGSTPLVLRSHPCQPGWLCIKGHTAGGHPFGLKPGTASFVPCPLSTPGNPHNPTRRLQAGPGGFPSFCGVQLGSGMCGTTRPPPTWPLGVGFRKRGAPSEQLGPVGGQGARVGAGPAAPAPQPQAGPARGALKEVGTGADEAARLRRWEEEGVLSTPQVVPRACATGLLLLLLLGKLPHASPGVKGFRAGPLGRAGAQPRRCGQLSKRLLSPRSQAEAFSCSCPKSQHNVPKPSPDLHPLPPFHQEAPLGQVCRLGWGQEGFMVS